MALVLAEQYDLGAVILAAQQPRLLLLVECSPEVAAPVRPALGLEAPAAVGVALEAHQRAMALMPGAVLQPVRVAGAGGHLRADAEVAAGGLLAAARGQLVDVLAQLLGGHPGAGVCDRQLAHPPAGGVEPLPVEVPHHAAASSVAECGDRVEPVDGQLTQALKVRALAAETLQQEGGVGDLELVPAVGPSPSRPGAWLRCVSHSGTSVGRYRTRGQWPPADAVRQSSGNASARRQPKCRRCR